MEQLETLVTLVDWVQFTVPFAGDLQPIYDLLRMSPDEFSEAPNGMNFYAKRKMCGNIWILYDGYAANTQMTAHVQMSGQGCRQYECYYGDSWEALFLRVYNAQGHFTRLDFAIDEFRYNGEKPFFSIRKLVLKVKRNECRSKFKSATRIEKMVIADGSSRGNTIYFGSDRSDIQIVAYEKDFERQEADMELEEGLTTWNRVEIRMKDERAQSAAMATMSGSYAGNVALSVLANYIEFVDKQKDTNKARWPRSKFWSDYLGEAQKLRLAVRAPDRTIEDKQTWIEKQVLPTLSQIWYALNGPGAEMFADMLDIGMERMTEAQWAQAETYRQVLEEEHRRLLERREEKRKEMGLKKVAPIRREKDYVVDFYRLMYERIGARLGNEKEAYSLWDEQTSQNVLDF